MSTLAFLLIALFGDAPQAATPPAQPAPEVALFARAYVVGGEITEGFGLERELGAPGSLADIVDASLLFPHQGAEKRTFPMIAVAPQQVKGAVDAKATLVIALDYLLPFVYADAGSDDGRHANIETALKSLEIVKVPLILGNVPDLRSAGTIINPVLNEKHMPTVEALAQINARIEAWAAGHTNVVIAPLATMYARIESKEGFGVRASSWPPAWMPELLQKDRVHPRMHGTIAAWLLGLDALCKAHRELDPARFDWSATSIFRKVYASKEAARKAAAQSLTDSMRLQPNRPPPGPPIKRPVLTPEEEMRQKLRGDEGRGEDNPRGKKEKQGEDEKDGKEG
ncbi:MAG: hypothetical protein JNL28_07005 [Planctomycetes bacterium]|nr:hypothetical protein [Planctomycetota bacterium]